MFIVREGGKENGEKMGKNEIKITESATLPLL